MNPEIQRSVERTRKRWLLSAMVNAGGRWAVLPAAGIALVGVGLGVAGVTELAYLLTVAIIGLAGVFGSIMLARSFYSRTFGAGTPGWTLLLDRALNLGDALPTLFEGSGEFRGSIETKVAAGLDPEKEKLAIPARKWGALCVAVILALLPLVFWRPSEEPPASDDQIAEEDPPKEAVDGAGNKPAGTSSGGGDKSEQPGGDGESNPGGGGDEGEVQRKPDGKKSEGGAGEMPDGTQPKEMKDNPPQNSGGVGDSNGSPEIPDPPEPDDIDTDLETVRPDAGEGETRTERRSRWVYNPEGENRDGTTPVPPETRHAGEKAVPRTKVTTKERAALEKIYRKLYE